MVRDTSDWKSKLAIAASALFALLIAGCSGNADGNSVFIFARGSDAHKLDPADVDDGESVNTLAQICEGLVRFKSGTLEIEPALAISHEILDGGLRYVFTLRDGVEFHDGTALDAAAAAYSFQRQMDPNHPAHLKEANFAYWKYLYQEIEEVNVIAPMQLEFVLSKPNASLLYSLAIFPAHLVSPNALDTHGREFQRHPIGTGPYKFAQWRPSEAVILERNDRYWGEKPSHRRLVIKVVPDNTTRLLQLKSGDIHGMDGLQPAEIAALREDESIKVYQEPGLNVGYLSFNTETDRLARLDVRQAISAAIDREALADVALNKAGSKAEYPLPPGFLGYPDGLEKIQFDLDAARAFVSANPKVFEEPITLHVMNAPRQYFSDPVVAASFIKGQLENVGISVKIVSQDFKSHLTDLRNGDVELGLIGWVGDNGDTDNFLSTFFASWAAEKGSANNYAFYRNDEMDALLLEGRRAVELSERDRIYKECLALWRRDLPILPLTHADNVVALRSGYEGFELQKIGDLRLGWIRSVE